MGFENLNVDNTEQFSMSTTLNQHIKDYRVLLYQVLFLMICVTTIKLFLLFKSPKSYKKFIDWIYNIKIKISGCEFTFYVAIIVWVLFLVLLFVGNIKK